MSVEIKYNSPEDTKLHKVDFERVPCSYESYDTYKIMKCNESDLARVPTKCGYFMTHNSNVVYSSQVLPEDYSGKL